VHREPGSRAPEAGCGWQGISIMNILP